MTGTNRFVYLLRSVSDPSRRYTGLSSDVAARLAAEFHDYSYGDGQVQRENHLCELASIGGELRELISSHPSSWDFGTFDDVKGRYIVVFPTLLRDDEQAAARRIFRI